MYLHVLLYRHLPPTCTYLWKLELVGALVGGWFMWSVACMYADAVGVGGGGEEGTRARWLRGRWGGGGGRGTRRVHI
jgi:hypothetical protein